MELTKFFVNKSYVQNILQDKLKNKVSTGYLFFSPDKKTNFEVIKCLATVLLCHDNGCLCCPDCKKIKDDIHPDVLLYPKGKLFTVEDAKDIIEQANKKSMLADIKIIVISDIDNSSDNAQNKLLKTLEEPPQNVIFLISATNTNKVLATIKSRLIKQEILPLNNSEITEIFGEYRESENYSLSIQNGEGYLGKTLEILQSDNYIKLYNLSKTIVTQLKSSGEIVNYLDSKMQREDMIVLLDILQSMYRDIIILKLDKDDLVKNKIIASALKNVKDEFSLNALSIIVNKINEANKKLFSNVSAGLIFESLLVSILEVKFLCK